MKRISIYLAGNVRKNNDENGDDSWRNEFKEKLRGKLKGVDIRFLDPTISPPVIKDSYSVFARDLYLVANCDFIVVEGRDKQGIGAGIEMLTAKMHGVPVLVVVSKKSYYRSIPNYFIGRLSQKQIDNWIHPFMFSLSDAIVENPEEAAKWIKEHLNEKKKIKDISVINKAIEYYKKTHYEKDDQAKDAFE